MRVATLGIGCVLLYIIVLALFFFKRPVHEAMGVVCERVVCYHWSGVG